MKHLLRSALLTGVLLHSLASLAQLPLSADKIQNAANDFYRRFPQEKLFVHTNQNAYTSGQTLWYKVYAMAYGKPSQLSKIVYVNLTDLNGKPLTQTKRPLTKGTANGDFVLPDTLRTGWYQLQAYTAWMLNFKDDAVYHQKIYIKNLHDAVVDESLKITLPKYNVQFYPEGGDLINGNKSNIAFKATDDHGLPAAITGELIINDKNSGIKLQTIHDGMGSFNLETYAADKYIINVRYPNNTTERLSLPLVQKTGTSLQANSTGEFITLNIFYSGIAKTEDAVIAAMQSNGLSSTYPIKLNKGYNLIRFKKSDYAMGIIRFTVFGEGSIPLTERIVFINNNDQVNAGLNTDTLSFKAKAANSFTFNIAGSKDKLYKGIFSIAVTDADQDAEPQENIMSAFLLSSELRGYINYPGYYFKNNSDTLQQQLDLVMLSNGWRHFKWDKILNNSPVVLKYSPERSQFVAGNIENYPAKKDLKVKFIIVDPNEKKHFENVLPDSAGRFAIDDDKLNGVAKLYYNVVDNQNKKQSFKVKFTGTVIDTLPPNKDSTGIPGFGQQIYSTALLDTLKRQQQTIDFEKDIVLKEVRIKAIRKRPVDQVIADHVKTLSPDRVFDLDLVNVESLPAMNLIQYIQGRFPGLEIYTGAGGKVVFRYRGASTLMERSFDTESAVTPPVFYLNETIVEYDDVKDISMYDLALVRYAPPPAWFAPLGGGLTGAMMLYTKNYKDHNIGGTDISNYDLYKLSGYSVSREFASPDYTIPAQLKKPDYRSTLYWNPNAAIDSDGNIKIRFYSSDKANRYRVTLQGIDNEGKMAYLSKVLQ